MSEERRASTTEWDVAALTDPTAHRDPRTLRQIVAYLRTPDGCPWDREQTTKSLRDAVFEEAQEVARAIDVADDENLAEELGDLLLVVAMHAQIAEERGAFTFEDVVEGICRKLIRRHPHVFGDGAARTAGEVKQTWDAIKAAERVARERRRS